MHGSSISITISVLGNIDTVTRIFASHSLFSFIHTNIIQANARANTKGHLEHITRYPAEEAASAIVHATALREHEIHYPAFLAVFELVHAVAPRLAAWIVRVAMS